MDRVAAVRAAVVARRSGVRRRPWTLQRRDGEPACPSARRGGSRLVRGAGQSGKLYRARPGGPPAGASDRRRRALLFALPDTPAPRRGRPNIVHPDPIQVGGLLEAKKISVLADTAYLPVSYHCPFGPSATAAILQLYASTTNVVRQKSFSEFDAASRRRAHHQLPDACRRQLCGERSPGPRRHRTQRGRRARPSLRGPGRAIDVAVNGSLRASEEMSSPDDSAVSGGSGKSASGAERREPAAPLAPDYEKRSATRQSEGSGELTPEQHSGRRCDDEKTRRRCRCSFIRRRSPTRAGGDHASCNELAARLCRWHPLLGQNSRWLRGRESSRRQGREQFRCI